MGAVKFGSAAGTVLMKVVVVVVLIFDGVSALKDVFVTVPQAVNVGDTVTLQCRYDLEGEALYMVKWYKGPREFFRYIPKEMPSTQVFAYPGINVDLSKSSPNEVALRNVQPDITGRYLCEVSTDAPNFYTQTLSGYMYVVDVPQEDPEMFIEKDTLEVGYTLRGNCTSPPSYPYANITWFLNGKRLNATNVTNVSPPSPFLMDTRRRPKMTLSSLDIEIDGSTFEHGSAHLKCVANIFNLYRKEVEFVLDEERPRPRPSSVLGTRDTASGSTFLLNLLIFPVVLVCLQFR